MNPKLTLAIGLLVFALADARNTNINVTSTIRLQTSGDPLTPADQELLVDKPALNKGFPFVIIVKTSDESFDWTDVRVNIIMYGSGGKKNVEENSGKIWLKGGMKSDWNNTYLFNVDVDKMISPISKIEISIDNRGIGPGWFLDSVTIYSPTKDTEQYFPYHQWLVINEANTVIPITLYEQMGMRKKRETEISWKVSVRTSDVFWAGTSANVFICIYGDKGQSNDITLDNAENNFERSHTDTFRITTPDLGKPYKIRVRHDNSGRYPGWNFRNVKLERYDTGDTYTFNCECWLTWSKGLSIDIPLDA